MLNRWIWICFAVTAKVVIGTGTANAVDEEGGKETYAPDYSLQAVPVLDVPTKENTEHFPLPEGFGTPAPQYNTAFPPPAGYSPYAVKSADILSPHTIGTDRIIAQYITGTSTGKAAGICRDNGIYKTVLLGFPFETVHSEVFRNNIMQNAMHFLISGNSSVLGWELY